MASATWESLFAGRTDLIRKMLFGSVLIKDYDPTDSLADFNPYDAATGGLSSTLLSDHGWNDPGYVDENGVKFAPATATSDTNAWQARLPVRTDFTNATETAQVVFLEDTPVVRAVFAHKPIKDVQALGTERFRLTHDLTPQLVYRSVLFIGVDGSGDNAIYGYKLYPKCLMTKPGEQDWRANKELVHDMTFTPYPDPVAGFAVDEGVDGPGWRALAGTTGTTTGTTTTGTTTTPTTP